MQQTVAKWVKSPLKGNPYSHNLSIGVQRDSRLLILRFAPENLNIKFHTPSVHSSIFGGKKDMAFFPESTVLSSSQSTRDLLKSVSRYRGGVSYHICDKENCFFLSSLLSYNFLGSLLL
jgi:hypothetical protein